MNELTIYNDDKLINLIKENFNESDNQLFELSFKLFNKTQTKPDDFIINFDDIYGWIGFTRKDHAKTLLTNNFKENKDYIKTPLFPKEEQENNVKFCSRDRGSKNLIENTDKRGGSNKETILLTIKCFGNKIKNL